jgi:hypothetical protein
METKLKGSFGGSWTHEQLTVLIELALNWVEKTKRR